MSDTPIDNMNFKQLRDEVQLLRDELARMKRMYEDMLYNLEDENFSSAIRKEKNDMKTQLSVTADGIKSVVSKTTDLETKTANLETQLSVTADGIKSVVSKTVNLGAAQAITTASERTDTTKLYLLNGVYYYYNDLSATWQPLGDASIYSMFYQSNGGFYLRGDVQVDGSAIIDGSLALSGDAIVGGTIKGANFQTKYSLNGENILINSEDNSIQVRYGDTVVGQWKSFSSVSGSQIDGNNGTLQIGSGGSGQVSAEGNWIFSSCNITDWGNNAPTAVFA